MSTDEKQVEERKFPSVRVRAGGKMNNLLDLLAEEYRESHEGRDVRWVYAPEHKPELSNVLTRRSMGYEEVTLKDLPIAKDLVRGSKPGDVVRIGDLILMSIEAELRKIYMKELLDLAQGQVDAIEEAYYSAIEEEAKRLGIEDPSHIARGKVDVREVTDEYEYEQPESSEGEE